MQQASRLEIVAARCWNVLNEGKPFYVVFGLTLFGLSQGLWPVPPAAWGWGAAPRTFLGLAGPVTWLWLLALGVPLMATFIRYDFPLHLRLGLWALWGLWLALTGFVHWPLVGLTVGAYLFFTVFLWGTLYYHLRIGTPWTNFLRFWRLVLINQDSTSGNFLEQVPKALITTHLLTWVAWGGPQRPGGALTGAAYVALCAATAFILHRWAFTWRPAELPTFATAPPGGGWARRVYMVVIDGCRKDRLAEAHTPFLDWLRAHGTSFEQMETIYPARTVCCFSSFFTGTYPREHGITSNLVWRLGVRCSSVFDELERAAKKGILLGIAHLIDAFGRHVDAVTAVMPNDRADAYIMARARQLVVEQDPDLLVVQLIATDQTGHSRGPLYAEYRQKIEEADRHIGEFYTWLQARGYLEDAVFLVCADHGQSDGIGGHGHLGPGERYVPFIVAGKGIARGRQVQTPHSIVSVAATLCHLLGAGLPDRARGPVLLEAFDPGVAGLPRWEGPPLAAPASTAPAAGQG